MTVKISSSKYRGLLAEIKWSVVLDVCAKRVEIK